MHKKFAQFLAIGVSVAAAVYAQAPANPPAAKLAFEVASIKPAPPLDPAAMMSGKAHIGMKVDAARVDIGSLSLSDLIRMAYKLKSYQLIGPDWINGMSAQRWDIMGKMPPGTNKDQVPEMLQTLLAERFKLEFHRETKEHSAYALTVAKTGLKMKEAPPDEPVKTEPAAPGTDPTPPPGNDNPQIKMTGSGDTRTVTVGGGEAGPMKMTVGPNGMHMEAEKMPMDGLIELLSKMTDKPVVDQTELKGKYKMALDISMAEMMAMARSAGAPVPATMPGGGEGKGPADAASDPSSAGSVFTTVQQLGLKLESKKLPVEVLVVDKLEKAPTEN
jgi:uncharacterized protein (TIGR03435 family)